MPPDVHSSDLECDVLYQFYWEETVFEPGEMLLPSLFPVRYFSKRPQEKRSVQFRPVPSANVLLIIRAGPLLPTDQGNVTCGNDPFSAMIVGIHGIDKVCRLSFQTDSEYSIVTFKPCGFSRIFNKPSGCVADRIVSLQSLLDSSQVKYFRLLSGRGTMENRVNRLFVFLGSLLMESRFTYRERPLLVFEQIHKQGGKVTLGKICRECGANIRTVERYFKVNIGISPKKYARMLQFNHVLMALLVSRFQNMHSAIFESGYYDQSHFLHDFKRFTGMSPTEYQKKIRADSIYTHGFIEICN